MRKHHDNALLIFARAPKDIVRGDPANPFSAFTWEDIDILFNALLGDTVRNACQLERTDVFLFRDPNELSDDPFLAYQQKLQFCDLSESPTAEQIQAAVDNCFRVGFQRVVVILENHPMISSKVLHRAFHQLRYEDDCLVVYPTIEGKCLLVGMKMNHNDIFDSSDGDPLLMPSRLLSKLCEVDNILFLFPTGYSLNSTGNIARLKRDIDALERSRTDFPAKTYEVMKVLDKKYKLRKAVR